MAREPKALFTDVEKISTIHRTEDNINKFICNKIILKGEYSDYKSLDSILHHDFFEQTEIEAFSCTNLESNKSTAVILIDSSTTTGQTRKDVAIPHAFFTAPSNQQVPHMLSDSVGLWIELLNWNMSLLLTVRAILSNVKAVKINNEKILQPSFEDSFCHAIQTYKVK